VESREVSQIVRQDSEKFDSVGIDESWGINRSNVESFLVEPLLEEYIEASTKFAVKLWTVLEEDQVDQNGYKIVYSEEDMSFGLAIKSNTGERFFLGIYGNLAETLYAM